MYAYGTEVQVTGKRHDTAAYPTAVVFDPRKVCGGGTRYRAIFRAVNGKNVEMNIYGCEMGVVVNQYSEDATTALIMQCRCWV